MMDPFGKIFKITPRAMDVADATLRDFSGGLFDMTPGMVYPSRFSQERVNLITQPDDTLRLRYGSSCFFNNTQKVVGIHYFGTRLIFVLQNGVIGTIDADYNLSQIWNNTIAAALPGSPAGWGVTTNVTFVEMYGELAVHNNINKPVVIDLDYTTTYLADPTTGSNVNTPIAENCVVVNDYCVLSNSLNAEIDISAKSTMKVWVGDPAPNDSIKFNVGGYVSTETKKITALGAYNNLLFVFFTTTVVIIKLGTYDTNNIHRPEVVTVLYDCGAYNSNSVHSHTNGIVVCSMKGLYTINSNVFGKYEVKPLIEDIKIQLYPNLPQQNESSKSFITYDRFMSTFYISLHKNDGTVVAFAYTHKGKLTEGTWTKLEAWVYDGACISTVGRIFTFQNKRIFKCGNGVFSGENYYRDKIHGEDVGPLVQGTEIPFTIESPWMDANTPLKTKMLQYITGDSIGDAQFTLDIFVDRLYKDVNGNLDPAVAIDYVAGSTGGYGRAADKFGGGRRFSDERYQRAPVKFKLFKYRITGQSDTEFVLTALSFIYATARYRR